MASPTCPRSGTTGRMESPDTTPVPLTYYCDSMRHLVCVPYSTANLHRMAEELGIKRCWFGYSGV